MADPRRKIAVVTTSRADYSHLFWPLRALSGHPLVDLQLIVLGAHLSPEFGATIREIENGGFQIAARIECLLSSDSDIGMSKTIGVATLRLADHLGALRPDLSLHLDIPSAVVAYHPVTLANDTLEEANALFAALEQLPEQLLFCYPNADAGSRALIERAKSFLNARGNGRIFINLDAVAYWSLLRQATLFLGNSSSGIMETPSFALPTVNIGIRQQSRESTRNILYASAN